MVHHLEVVRLLIEAYHMFGVVFDRLPGVRACADASDGTRVIMYVYCLSPVDSSSSQVHHSSSSRSSPPLHLDSIEAHACPNHSGLGCGCEIEVSPRGSVLPHLGSFK
jgi:hypothetical protein